MSESEFENSAVTPSQFRPGHTPSDANVIGAIRLLVEGSPDNRTLRKVLVELLSRAAPTTGSATLSVWLLIDAVKATSGTDAARVDGTEGT